MRAARAILYDCGAAQAVAKLRANGFRVRCVGHSLGAGVAALATTLLNLDDPSQPQVTASLYAVPACCSPALAEAPLDGYLHVPCLRTAAAATRRVRPARGVYTSIPASIRRATPWTEGLSLSFNSTSSRSRFWVQGGRAARP